MAELKCIKSFTALTDDTSTVEIAGTLALYAK